MKYNTVVFDLDGTLLNTLEDLMDAVNYALDTYGYPKRTLSEIRNFVGNGVRRLMERSAPKEALNPDMEGLLSAFREYYSVHCEDKTCAYEGVVELMKQLTEAGFKLAIVSNKLDSAVKELSDTYFDAYVQAAIGENEGVRRKPAPDMVENALKQLGSSKSEAVYVGDSEVDIQTAANAGLFCISVAWGFRDVDFLKANGAKTIAYTPDEALDIIMKL